MHVPAARYEQYLKMGCPFSIATSCPHPLAVITVHVIQSPCCIPSTTCSCIAESQRLHLIRITSTITLKPCTCPTAPLPELHLCHSGCLLQQRYIPLSLLQNPFLHTLASILSIFPTHIMTCFSQHIFRRNSSILPNYISTPRILGFRPSI